MISSAQTLSRTRQITRPTSTAPLQRGSSPTLIIAGKRQFSLAGGALLFIVLVLSILTHTGTYSVALPHLVAQTDVQTTDSTHSGETRQPKPIMFNASKALIRLDQTSNEQYSSQAEHDAWSPSSCSAASVTEVMNAYGHSYKIADILKIEADIGAITPSQGLLSPEGIDQTATKFGFQTQTLANPTLKQILTIANSGKPVIVNFPSQVWTGGHFLVVVGSITVGGISYVHLADSSTLNMQYMLPTRFEHYWQGLAKVLTSDMIKLYSIIGKPTITADFINQVLSSYHSPATGKGQTLYKLGISYGIDPAFALAFFLHESTFGTKGEASSSLSLGNIRCIRTVHCRDNFAWFDTWEDGFREWYKLIKNLYIAQWGLTTIDQIIPTYAPAADHNNEQDYINSLKHALDTWHTGQLRP